MEQQVHAVVLAAGKSSRFGFQRTKQLVPLCGLPLVMHVVELLYTLSLPTTVVLGHCGDEIQSVIQSYTAGKAVTFAFQKEQKGTGDAVLCSESLWSGDHVLILNGDMPLLTREVIATLLHQHINDGNAITFCVTDLANPAEYGRVLCDEQGAFFIREARDCTDEERAITRVNAGVYCVRKDFLKKALSHLQPSSITNEWYITDLVAIAHQLHEKVAIAMVPSAVMQGVNRLDELVSAESLLYERIRSRWLQHGVRLINPSSILIDSDVRIGRGTVISAGAHLQQGAIIGKDVFVGPYSIISKSHLADGVRVESHTVIENSRVESGAQVGPFARIRDYAQIGEQVVIGNFVEVKNSELRRKSKAKHLCYLGDATVGEKANIGAGVITCNYDGKAKHHTNIGAEAMVGANSSLVAPVSIGAQSYIAAGSTITRDVPRGALGIGRARQVIKEAWQKTYRVASLIESEKERTS